MAAIALLRMHDYTGDSSYRDKAEQTLKRSPEIVGNLNFCAATYGMRSRAPGNSPVQVIVIPETEADAAPRL